MTQEWKRQREAQNLRPGLPISATNLQRLLIKALYSGDCDLTSHFKKRCVERDFTTPDAQNVICTGRICGKPVYSDEHENFVVTMRGKIEGKILEIKVGLFPLVDFECPTICLITGNRGVSNDHDNDEGKE